MTFQNLPVDSELLPTVAAIQFEPMAPNYVPEVRLQQALIWSLVTIAASLPPLIVVKPVALRIALIALPFSSLLIGILLTWLAVASARAKGAALREHDIAYRSGIWWRKLVVLPFDRIQHVELSSGPLQRRYGLASLKFFTAGGAGIDLRIDGLELDRARRLREFILQRVAALR